MKKRAYRAIHVNRVNDEDLIAKIFEKEIVVGIDVAKTDYFCNIMTKERESITTIKWKHPNESSELLDLITSLPAKNIDIAMEPSGSYGDPIRNMFINAGFKVFRVSPKRSHDAKEVFDGVPSSHDAKSASIIARLHLDGASEIWSFKEEHERDLSAVTNTLDLIKKQFRQNINRLGALLARHWPELDEVMKVDKVSILKLIRTYGSPKMVNINADGARLLLRSIRIKKDKIEAILESSRNTLGVPMTACEEEQIKYLAKLTRNIQKDMDLTKKKVEEMSECIESVDNMSGLLGKVTAAVVVSSAGDPLKYDAPKKYLKSIGLNLKVESSGKKTGRLRITKRGASRARQWIFYAVLRLIQKDDVINAWYLKKVARDGGVKMKALIAVMRKIVLALWHVARGSEFNSSRLFDVQKLKIA